MLNEIENGPLPDMSLEALVPFEVRGQTLYMSVHRPQSAGNGQEEEVASWRPSLADVLQGLTALATELGERLQETGASTVSVEFGCEIGVSSGTFVAVVGKGSSKSTFKVGLQWTKPAE